MLRQKNVIKEEKSAGIYLEDSDAVNAENAKITVHKGESAGIYGKFTSGSKADNTIENSGEIILKSGTGKQSAGIYGELESTAAKKLTISNKNKIEVNMEESVGIYAKNGKSSKTDLIAENEGTIDLKSKKSVGMLADKSAANNKNEINITNEEATGMYGTNGSEVTNTSDGTILIEAPSSGNDSKSTGIYVTESGTKGVNDGNIIIKGKKGTGMLATKSAEIVNNNLIQGPLDSVESVIGMYGVDSGTIVTNEKDIELHGQKSTGIFSKDDAVAKNKGTITLKPTSKNSVGMFGSSSASGKTINLINAGTIDIESESSTGMFTKNKGDLGDSTVENKGTINLKQKSTVGIYTPKSDIKKVGKINLNDDADSSVAVYLSDEAKADTSTGEIDLNEKSQNQVAYYIK